jgi:hypothetical protein
MGLAHIHREGAMAWRVDGTYFENCSCEVACPCTVGDFAVPATYDRCRFLFAFHIDSGQIEGVDVSGVGVAVIGDTPQFMLDGKWRVGVLIDAQASQEQADKIGAVFSGQLGGPMGALGPLVGEMLGVERAPFDYADEGRQHRVKIGDAVDLKVEDIVSPLEPEGPSPRITSVHHPANSTLTIARGVSSKVSALGVEFSGEGKSAFSAPFSWSG